MNRESINNLLSSLGVDQFSRRLAKNTGYLFLGGGMATLIATGQSLLLARSLGSQDFGYLALIVASVGIVLQFIDFRTWEALITLLPGSMKESSEDDPLSLVQSFFLLDLAAGLLSVVLIAILGDFLARTIAHNPGLASSIRLYAWAAPAMLISTGTCMGALRSFDKFAQITIKSVAIGALQFSLILVAILTGAGLVGVVIAIIVSQFVDMGVSLFLVGAQLRLRFGSILRWNGDAFRLLRRHAGLVSQFWLSGTVKGVQSRADVVLLGALATPAAAGIYRLALDMASLFGRIGSPIQDSLLPVMADLDTGKDHTRLKRIIKQVSLSLSLIMCPAVLIAVFFGEPVLVFLAGEEYRAAALPFTILLIGVAVNTILIWTRPLLVARKRIREANLAIVAGFIFELSLLLVLVPPYQATGAAIATTGMYMFVGLISAWFGLQGLNGENGSGGQGGRGQS